MSGLPPYYPDDPNFQQEWDDETNQGSWLCHVSIFLVVLIDLLEKDRNDHENDPTLHNSMDPSAGMDPQMTDPSGYTEPNVNEAQPIMYPVYAGDYFINSFGAPADLTVYPTDNTGSRPTTDAYNVSTWNTVTFGEFISIRSISVI
jgi:hypothetical protein